MFENIIIHYNVQAEDPSTDFSDDDLDEKNGTIRNAEEIRRVNQLMFNQNEQQSSTNNRIRSSNRKFSFRYQTGNESDSNEL
ncbi:hypothetical protein BLA29_014835, partial [Euroglyphus maynei]